MKASGEASAMNTENILNNPFTSIQFAFDKRRRNLEKRKIRLHQYEVDLHNGKKLSEQQIEARYCIGEVDTQLEFLKEINRTLNSLHKEYLKSVKQKEDAKNREEEKKIKRYLQNAITYQNIASQFRKAEVKNAFINGISSAVKITEDECKIIEALSEKFDITMSKFSEVSAKSEESAETIYQILSSSKEKVINDYLGAEIVEVLNKIALCDYMQEMNDEEETIGIRNSSNHGIEREEQCKDPKVIFVHGINGSPDFSEVSNEAVDTEFGFENCIDQKSIVRDPPPPIPLPASIPDDPTGDVKSNRHAVQAEKVGVWVSDGRSGSTLEDQPVVAHNGYMVSGDGAYVVRGERRSHGNDVRTTINENEHGKSDDHQRTGQTRYDNRDGRRNRGGRGRGNAPSKQTNAPNNACGDHRERGAANGPDGHRTSGRRGGYGRNTGYRYDGSSQRQLGFNFSSDPV